MWHGIGTAGASLADRFSRRGRRAAARKALRMIALIRRAQPKISASAWRRQA